MGKRRTGNSAKLVQIFYDKPKLNKKALQIKKSFQEVRELLKR